MGYLSLIVHTELHKTRSPFQISRLLILDKFIFSLDLDTAHSVTRLLSHLRSIASEIGMSGNSTFLMLIIPKVALFSPSNAQRQTQSISHRRRQAKGDQSQLGQISQWPVLNGLIDHI